MTTTTLLTKAWPNQTDRALLQQMLRAANVPSDSIPLWLGVKPTPHQSVCAHAGEILAWLMAFNYDSPLAARWFNSSHVLTMSTMFAAHNWSIADADRLRTEVMLMYLAKPDGHVSTEQDWVGSGLAPAFVFACFEAGISDHQAAKAIRIAARKHP